MNRRHPVLLPLLALPALLASPVAALADSGAAEPVWWMRWEFTPLVVIATVLTLWLYARGVRRAGPWQRAGFVGGSLLLFLVLQGPLDALAEESFAFHQIQHLSLLSLVPLLIALSAPAGPLIAGMPDWLRRRVYAPIASNRVVRGLFGLLSTPFVAAAFFIAAMLFWLQPAMQTAALQDETIHDWMHFSMLIAGMFLYFSALDPRAPPTGAGYGARIFSVLAVLLANIPLGAYLSYKQRVLYPVYGAGPHLGMTPVIDERIGGLIQYVPGSMMFVVVALLVFGLWNRQESRAEGRRRRGLERKALVIDPGDTLARRNLKLALTLAAVGAFMLAGVFAAGMLEFVKR